MIAERFKKLKYKTNSRKNCQSFTGLSLLSNGFTNICNPEGGTKFNDAHKPRNHRRSISFYSRLSLLNNYQVIVADVFAILQLYQIIF